VVVLFERKTAGGRHNDLRVAFARASREVYVSGVSRTERDSKLVVQVLAGVAQYLCGAIEERDSVERAGLPQ
jgi:hypothetical protein